MIFLDKIGWHGSTLLLGIEIQEDSSTMHLGLFRQKKGLLFMEESWAINSEEALLKALKKYAPIPLFINLKAENIIEKCIPKGKEPVSSVLGVHVDNRKDFYLQQIPCDQMQWTALIRKTVLEDHLKPFEAFRDRLIYINLSGASIVFLIPALGNYQSTTSYLLDGKYAWEGKLVPNKSAYNKSIDNETTDQEISSDELAYQLQIDRNYVNLYATAIHYLHSQGKDVQSISFLFKHEKRIYQESIWTNVLVWAGAGLILIALGGQITNHLLRKQMQADILISQQHATELKRIDEQAEKIKNQREFLVKASGKTLQASRISFYADRMLESCPENLFLDRFIIYPTKKDLNQLDIEIETEDIDVLLQGLSKKSASLAVFAQSLQELELIAEVDLIASEYDMKAELYRFTMKVKLNRKDK